MIDIKSYYSKSTKRKVTCTKNVPVSSIRLLCTLHLSIYLSDACEAVFYVAAGGGLLLDRLHCIL